MTSMVQSAILCRREVQLPTATVCSSRASYRLRSPIVRRLPSLFVGASPRLPDCDRQNTCFEFSHCCCCETWTRSLGCVQFSQECLETRTQESRHACKFPESLTRLRRRWEELWFACEDTGVCTGGHAHSSPLFAVRTKESDTCVQVFSVRKFGPAHDGQPTVILRDSARKRRVLGSVRDRQPTIILQVSVRIRRKRRRKKGEKKENANLQLSYFFFADLIFPMGFPIYQRLQL